MEKIGESAARRRSELTLQRPSNSWSSSPDSGSTPLPCLADPQAWTDPRTQYPTLADFLKAFNPDLQTVAGCYPDRAHFGTAPPLRELDRLYGAGSAVAWLVIQLGNYSETCFQNHKMHQTQMRECARVVCTRWGWLKVSDFLLFFFRAKMGEYKGYFGSQLDTQAICQALGTFKQERDDAMGRLMKRE